MRPLQKLDTAGKNKYYCGQMDKKTIGKQAFVNKTGIHAQSPDEKKQAGARGNQAFLSKWENEEFKKLHIMKVRLGKLVARWNRIPRSDFGFFG